MTSRPAASACARRQPAAAGRQQGAELCRLAMVGSRRAANAVHAVLIGGVLVLPRSGPKHQTRRGRQHGRARCRD